MIVDGIEISDAERLRLMRTIEAEGDADFVANLPYSRVRHYAPDVHGPDYTPVSQMEIDG